MQAKNAHKSARAVSPPRFQFGLPAIFAITTLAALTSAIWRSLGCLALVVPATACFAVVQQSAIPRHMQRILFVCTTILGAMATAHAWSCCAAYETVGEAASCFWYIGFLLYFFPFHLLAMRDGRFSIGVGLVLVTLFVAPQVVWSVRLERLRGEVLEIIAFADRFKEATGRYPKDLSNYEFKSPSLKPYIDYGLCLDDTSKSPTDFHFVVWFWPAQRGVSHWYSATTGWGYYPD
jgi:hypothetical protein